MEFCSRNFFNRVDSCKEVTFDFFNLRNEIKYDNFSIDNQKPVMTRYVCNGCYYTYDPDSGIPDHGIEPGTSFADLPEDWICPECGLGKDSFREYKE